MSKSKLPEQSHAQTSAASPTAGKAAAGEKKKKKSGKAEPAEITETGGPKGLEPTRYGDWESKGRAIDF
jgi:hypothetical protein